MAAKKKCKFCGEYGYDHIKINAGSFCNFDHATKWGLEKTAKDRVKAEKKALTVKKKENAQRKREFYISDTKHQHKLTQKAFNKMRVTEELLWFKRRGIEPYCISCGKTKMDWCCGHFKTVGGSGALRYERRNTYLQCNFYCNMNKSGNIEGCKNTHGFKEGLIKRFGDSGADIIEYCQNHQGDVYKWEGQELADLRKEFYEIDKKLKQKLKELGEQDEATDQY